MSMLTHAESNAQLQTYGVVHFSAYLVPVAARPVLKIAPNPQAEVDAIHEHKLVALAIALEAFWFLASHVHWGIKVGVWQSESPVSKGLEFKRVFLRPCPHPPPAPPLPGCGCELVFWSGA